MKRLLIIVLLVALSLRAYLSENNHGCDKYKEKFGIAYQPDGTRVNKLAFTGGVAFVSESSNIKVNLTYSDADLFNDAIYFGLVE